MKSNHHGGMQTSSSGNVGAWGMTTTGEQWKKALTRDGIALFTTLHDQIMQPTSQNRMVVRPSVPADVRAWWLATAQPLFAYFGEWIKGGSIENVISWTTRLTQLRGEAARLGLLVLPSDFFDAIDVGLRMG